MSGGLTKIFMFSLPVIVLIAIYIITKQEEADSRMAFDSQQFDKEFANTMKNRSDKSFWTVREDSIDKQLEETQLRLRASEAKRLEMQKKLDKEYSDLAKNLEKMEENEK